MFHKELISDEHMEMVIMNNKKYSKFVIYKIYPTDCTDFIYIGSTCSFNRRKAQHKKNTTNKRGKLYNCTLYRFIRCIGGWEKMSCDIVEEYPCTCKKDGLLREKELMLIHHANLNTNNPIDI